jgi:outer membrane protein assembly factor BamD
MSIQPAGASALVLAKCGLIALILLSLTACSGLGAKDDSSISAELLYQQARAAMDDNNFQLAIEKYEKLEIDHPFSAETRQGQIDIIYAYYRADEPDSAIAAADRFIKLYPRHPRVDYAYYLRALVNFDRTSGMLDRLLKRDSAVRDPHTAEESFHDFAELVKRFPDSPYATDATQRMVHLRNYLARHELYVARYYIKLKAYVAAANRSRYIIENYPRAPVVTEALEIMAAAYTGLGLDDLAAETRKVIELNPPSGPVPMATDAVSS